VSVRDAIALLPALHLTSRAKVDVSCRPKSRDCQLSRPCMQFTKVSGRRQEESNLPSCFRMSVARTRTLFPSSGLTHPRR
jgi:hypothetical protein